MTAMDAQIQFWMPGTLRHEMAVAREGNYPEGETGSGMEEWRMLLRNADVRDGNVAAKFTVGGLLGGNLTAEFTVGRLPGQNVTAKFTVGGLRGQNLTAEFTVGRLRGQNLAAKFSVGRLLGRNVTAKFSARRLRGGNLARGPWSCLGEMRRPMGEVVGA